ncbi:MAG: immunoglobulin domain-containing protein, partial [Verrucomicrobia bacterium]|nr:immunoglobulin domain-containing protein [Verrucomicrobiota bacterium]
MKSVRIPSLCLALLLQCAPLCRFLESNSALEHSPAGILLKWIMGAFVVAGTYHAVSAASVPDIISSSPTAFGTNGVPFKYKITTSPHVAFGFQIDSLDGSPAPPPGLVLNIPGRPIPGADIRGTPTAPGVYTSLITAWNSNYLPYVATLQLVITIYDPPAITVQPVGQTVNSGEAVSFSVTATGFPAPSYQWQKDGVGLPGQTGPDLSLSNVTSGDAGSYSVLVSNPAGRVTSLGASLSVNATSVPLFTTQPTDLVIDPGNPASFTVAAGGVPAPTFQWRKNGVNLAGATGATYTIA